MKNLKKLTILHSNDMHGDFNAENIDDSLIVASSCIQVIEETLINSTHQNAKGTGRLIIHREDGTVTGVAL